MFTLDKFYLMLPQGFGEQLFCCRWDRQLMLIGIVLE
jgi:hypothetical protein